jgi:acyl-CoA-binding protein
MHAGEADAPQRAVEFEQTAVGDQRDRAPGAIDIFGAAAWRADEIDFGHQRAARVIDAEQDYFRYDAEIGGTERAGKTHRRVRPPTTFRRLVGRGDVRIGYA